MKNTPAHTPKARVSQTSSTNLPQDAKEVKSKSAEAVDVEVDANYQGAEVQKNTTEDGGVKMMSREEGNRIKEQIVAASNELNKMDIVVSVTTEGFAGMQKSDIAKAIEAEFAKFGNRVDRQNFGVILLEFQQINKALNYLNTDGEKAALLTVPRVLKRGIIVDMHTEHKERNVDSFTIAAPVEINGKRGNVGVVVQRVTGTNRFKTLRILLPNGKAFEFVQNKEADSTTGSSSKPENLEGVPIESASKNSIRNESGIVKNESAAMYSYRGINQYGIEVYETSEATMNLTWADRVSQYEKLLSTDFVGRTARFKRNGHIYYAQFDPDSAGKILYGEKGMSKAGKKAVIRAGADGDIFDLVENARYDHSAKDTKNHKAKDGFTDYFDYFYKTVQIDGKVFDININVKKQYGSKHGYTYTIKVADNKATKASPALAVTQPSKVQGTPSTTKISQPASIVNNNSAPHSDRDPDAVSNRTLLANALESAATNDIERQKLREYKDQIETLDAHEKRLRELNEQIKELSFAKGPRDSKKLTDLRIEAKKTANRIDILDKKLFGLEATTPLKSVLERERAAVRKRERKKSREALAAQPTKHSDRDELLPSEYNRLTRKKSIKVSDQELAMIGKQRKSKYSSMKEYDIPIIDFFRIGDYRIPNNGFTYYIRNSGAETFSVVMRRKIKPNIRHETREVISDERRIDNEATNSSDAQKRSERGLDRGNLGSSGDRGKLSENAGRGISAEESQRNGSSGQGHADSGTVKHSDRDNAPTFYSQMANTDITDSMKDSVLTEGQPLYQDRDTESVSNRSLLANAFEGIITNPIEKQKIQEYKGKVAMLDAEEKKLRELNAQIKELSFAKGPKDTKKVNDLRFDAQQTANRIATLDKTLLRLEAATPLQNILKREKDMVRKREQQKSKEALAEQKAAFEAKQKETIDKWRDSRKAAVAKARETAEKRDAIDEKSGDQSTKSSNRQPEKNSLATEETVKYSDNRFFADNVFPPYNISHSDSHEVAERWARSEEGRIQKQRLLSHHGEWYVIQVVDDMDYGYQIVHKLPATNYNRRARKYGTIGRYKSSRDAFDQSASHIRGRTSVRRTRSGVDSDQSGHRGENPGLSGVDEQQVRRREIPTEQTSTDRSSSEDRERGDEPSVKIRRLDELGARAKWLREKIKSDRVSREKKSEYRKELRKVQNEMEELMPGYYPSGSEEDRGRFCVFVRLTADP